MSEPSSTLQEWAGALTEHGVTYVAMEVAQVYGRTIWHKRPAAAVSATDLDPLSWTPDSVNS